MGPRTIFRFLFPYKYYAIDGKNFLNKLPIEYFNSGHLTFVMNDRRAGFFSHFFQVLGAIDFCKTNKHNLILDFRSGPYVEGEKGENWWNYYFESNECYFNPGISNQEVVYQSHDQISFAGLGTILPIRTGNSFLVHPILQCKLEIIDSVSHFVDRCFRDKFVIGIHYRGTDKAIEEAPKVPYSYVLKLLKKFNNAHFFVATDEIEFLEFMLSHFGNRVIYYNSTRSVGGTPLHLDDNQLSPYQLGKDALIDCLLLSKCQMLLRTESNLSQASSIFNPSLKVVNMTMRFLKDQSKLDSLKLFA